MIEHKVVAPMPPKYPFVSGEGLQLQFGRNLFQAIALLIFAVIGAAICFRLTDDRPDIAALAGGVVGAVAGTFLSGFVLMFLPPKPQLLMLSEIATKYQYTQRKLIISGLIFVSSMVLGAIVWKKIEQIDSAWVFVGQILWICALVGLCAYGKGLASHLRNWKCPRCGGHFEGIKHSCQTAVGGNSLKSPAIAE